MTTTSKSNKNPSEVSLKSFIKRTIVVWIGNIIGLLVISYLGVGLILDNWITAIVIVTVMGIINGLLWPILSRLFMPFLIYTFGIGSLVLNGLLIYLISYFTPGTTLDPGAIFIAPLSMAIVTTILSSLLTINDDSSYYRAVTRDILKRRKKRTKNYPGLIILEIDGLSKDILEEAIANNSMPTIKRWIENKSHKLKVWETDLSSQTGASQAGILHGNNKDLTAFRWVEKDKNNKIVESTGFSDAPMIEKRISNGKGLLVENGASRSNLFSGDTDNVIFTSSKINDIKKMYNNAWYAVFYSPNNFPRIVVLFLWEMLVEIKSQIVHVIKNVKPRIRRKLSYIPTRAGANVFLREITTQTLIGDILVGDIDVAYATYVGYDEVAHHSGIRDNDVWNVLKKIDLQFHHLEKAVESGDRQYYFVIQSDHGQGNGATFKQRYGVPFENYVRSFLPEDMTMFSYMDSNLDHFGDALKPFREQVDGFKEQIGGFKNQIDKQIDVVKDQIDKQLDNINERYGSNLNYIKEYVASKHSEKSPEKSEINVLASGNLALIYFSQWENRLTYEQIVYFFPDLIPGLVNHEGIGFILIDSIEKGPMVIGSEGIYYLDTDIIEGKNPLEVFGKNAPKHLKRSNSFKYTPDILVNSFYDPESEEICAFEELVGSHGGIGGTQSYPFILYPYTWEVPEELIGAESIYKVLKKELNDLKNKKSSHNS